MKLHLHVTPEAVAAGTVTTDLLMLADLAKHRILRADSEVWLSTETEQPLIWALDSLSRLVYVHRSRVPGVIKLTDDRLRWSPAAKGEPTIDLDATRLTGSRTARVQFVLLDARGGEPLKVYNAVTNSLIHPDDEWGWWVRKRWVIVDTRSNTMENSYPLDTGQAVHEAHVLGAQLLASAVPYAEAIEIAETVAPVEVELGEDILSQLDMVTGYAEQVAEYVRTMVEQAAKAKGNGHRELAGAAV
jgi:hypothetical protein